MLLDIVMLKNDSLVFQFEVCFKNNKNIIFKSIYKMYLYSYTYTCVTFGVG
jgi:hypothetical protein